MKVYIGADHRGFSLKEKIKTILQEKNIPFADLGNTILDPTDDYPEFAEKVAQHVAQEQNSLGIVACGSGVGVDITANKIVGIRSALVMSPQQVTQARQDDNVNVMALAADFFNEKDLESTLTAFLNTPYDASEKHTRRLNEIQNIEHEV
jgi:ribose 5-phosphate isomerase B